MNVRWRGRGFTFPLVGWVKCRGTKCCRVVDADLAGPRPYLSATAIGGRLVPEENPASE